MNYNDPHNDTTPRRLQKHEIYLIVAALILAAVLIAYNVLSAPPLVAPTILYQTSSDESLPQEDSAASAQAAAESEDPVPSASTESSSPPASSAAESRQVSSARASGSSQSAGQTRINVNTATLDELMELPGIGEVKAKAIISYREQHGDFLSPEDLLNVYGIGEKTLEKMKPYLIF